MKNPIKNPDWRDKTVLIAEDLDDNYAVLAALLQQTGIHILWAHNGMEAIEMTSSNPEIDIVLMDISMPDIDGFEALHRIRKLLPEKIVIAQTAHALFPQLAEEDFNDIILKPTRRSFLIEILGKYLN